jgi:hypothetical protein
MCHFVSAEHHGLEVVEAMEVVHRMRAQREGGEGEGVLVKSGSGKDEVTSSRNGGQEKRDDDASELEKRHLTNAAPLVISFEDLERLG